jgi:hypothetical protein
MEGTSVQLDKQEAALAAALKALWEHAHGAPAGRVRVVFGPDSVTMWIEDAFSPAEWAVTRHAEGYPTMQHYAEQLLVIIQPDLWAQVEAIMARRIVSGDVRADVAGGHVLCFFILGEQPGAAARHTSEGGTHG